MNNKVILIFGLLSFLFLSKAFSQEIKYEYDENGSRVLRDVIILKQTNNYSTPQDSSSKNIDSTLAQTNVIEASFAGNNVKIYPNPVKYDLIVEIENISGKKAEINVCDVFGKYIEKVQVVDNRTLIDFSQKAMGTYLLKMTIENKSDVWKIIKK